MYQVLLAVDSNEDRARSTAKAVARLPGIADVVILNIFEEFNVTGEAQVDSKELYDDSEFPESVSIVQTILKNAGIEPVKRREHGNPPEVILSVADEIDADLIAVSGRKRSPAGKALFGSVTQSVLLSAECPVLVATTN